MKKLPRDSILKGGPRQSDRSYEPFNRPGHHFRPPTEQCAAICHASQSVLDVPLIGIQMDINISQRWPASGKTRRSRVPSPSVPPGHGSRSFVLWGPTCAVSPLKIILARARCSFRRHSRCFRVAENREENSASAENKNALGRGGGESVTSIMNVVCRFLDCGFSKSDVISGSRHLPLSLSLSCDLFRIGGAATCVNFVGNGTARAVT